MNNLNAVQALKAEVTTQFKPLRSKSPRVFQETFEECLHNVADNYGFFEGVPRLRAYLKKSLSTKPNWGCNEAIKIVKSGIFAIYKI